MIGTVSFGDHVINTKVDIGKGSLAPGSHLVDGFGASCTQGNGSMFDQVGGDQAICSGCISCARNAMFDFNVRLSPVRPALCASSKASNSSFA